MIINCVAYQEGRRIADIAVDQIGAWVGRPECFVWVALKDPEPAELDAMQAQFGLHELAVQDARHGHQRPKIEEYGDSLFVVLHTLEAEGDDLVSGEVDVFVGANYVLSVRNGTRRGFADVRQLAARAEGLVPGDCVAFEDSVPGVVSALGAGMKVVGVAQSYPAEKLRFAHRIVDSLAALEPGSLRGLFEE